MSRIITNASFDVSAAPSQLMRKDSIPQTFQSNDEVSMTKLRRSLVARSKSDIVNSRGNSPACLDNSDVMMKQTPETQRVQAMHIESTDQVDNLNSPDLQMKLR